ncbi:flavodoxin-dependent (E)-4-hydroxy-3-methylbut-2-enyl-diphosphate synthase [Breznakia pachnodae]|uniref:4-hydroxy-3-methylbut-2-en-1-yl diphosphate synthase (flavodoxin) n=1 Tax=Breznakia pachnodae TaxID=265178 RepID=A0ABU0E8D2_9FIRM|nr:flavodoxin-dependent (E)-4-hydroxy-3-methylbut-2-enyl-diphosphate synthase [Breznakia pachnodae]MDQ0362963.1 (E)-4-hydroxy-3-methylbut-2-enyl-diphosphate synthase [Breznakia pachnodae]
MKKRETTRQIKVRDIAIGGQNRIVIQSMCSYKTSNTKKIIQQILDLEKAGCETVRLSVMDNDDAVAIKTIKENTNIPLVADIHFNYKLAIAAIENGIDKIRLNPGNIGSKENVEKVVTLCKEKKIPIRIGINSGSLEKDIHEKYGKPTAEGMIESAQRHVKILEDMDFYDICLSFKSSDVQLCIDVYTKASEVFDYPLHLGVTEAGSFNTSSIKSSVALGTLIERGIGDTMRVSVNGDPVSEMIIAKQILKCFNLIKNVPNLIACPTCGRTQFDIKPIVDEIEVFLQTVNKDVTVAIMGCAVNGPGEAKHADIAIAGGRNEGLLIRKGEIIERIPQDQMIERLKKEIMDF